MQQVFARELFKKFEQARYLPIDNSLPVDKKPQWLDLDKFHKGRQLFIQYSFSCTLGVILGTVLMGQVPSVVMPLLFTRKCSSIPAMCQRLYSTVYHNYQWVYGDVWDVNGEAHQSIKNVRRSHSQVVKRMNTLSPDSSHPPVWLSQYDMAMGQYSQICFCVLSPRKVGLTCSDEDIMCMLHYWAGIGYLMGIEDRFNIAMQCDTVEDTRAFYMEIVEQVVLPTWSHQKEEYLHLLQLSVLVARQEGHPFADYGCFKYLAFDMIDIPLSEKTTWKTTICTAIHLVLIKCASMPVIRPLMNFYVRFTFWRQSKFYKGRHPSNVQLLWDLCSRSVDYFHSKIQFLKNNFS